MTTSRTPRLTASKMLGYLGVLGFAVALSGCAGSGSGGEAGSSIESEGRAEMVSDLQSEDVLGSWTSDEPGNPSLTFTEAGEVRGTDGCNKIVSRFQVDGDRLQIERFATTLKGCPGIDSWLRGVSEIALDGDQLTVFDRAGEQIGTLSREASGEAE